MSGAVKGAALLFMVGCHQGDGGRPDDSHTDGTDTGPEGTEILVRLGESVANATLAVDHVQPVLPDYDLWNTPDVVETGDTEILPFDGGVEVVLSLDEPPDSQIVDLGVGASGVMLLVHAFDDVDRDGTRSEDEPSIAVSDDVLFFVRDPGSSRMDFVPDAWQARRYDDASITPSDPGFPERLDLRSLVRSDTVSAAGSVADGVEGDRIAAVNTPGEYGLTTVLVARPVEQPLSSPFAVTFSGVPDPARMLNRGVVTSTEILVAYDDLDNDASYDAEDVITGVGCFEDQMVLFTYADPPSGAAAVLDYLVQRLVPGWQARVEATDAPMRHLTEEERDAVVVKAATTSELEACGF